MSHLMAAQLSICLVHVAHDDGDMLEPEVVAARVYGHGPPLWREVFRQVNKLIAQLHAHDAHPRAEDALQPLVFAARRFDVRDFFKRQNLGEKLH